jgi:hypothetical protein
MEKSIVLGIFYSLFTNGKNYQNVDMKMMPESKGQHTV